MTSCRNLGGYLARTLDPAGRAAFESHASNCPSCRSEIERWNAIAEAVAGAAGAEARPITSVEREEIVDLARFAGSAVDEPSRGRPGVRLRVLYPAVAAIALVVSISIFWVLESARDDRDVGSGTAVAPGGAMVIAAPPDRAESASRGRSRLVLAPGTEIEIAEEGSSRVRYRLARGMVALEVEGLGPGESIAVATGDLEAEVLGTVFAVSIEDGRTAVDVVEGIVVVSRRDSPTWRVGGGQRLVAPLDRRASVEDLPAEDRAAVIDLLALWEAPAAGASRGDGSGSGGTPEPAGEISGAPARETAIAEGGGTGDRARDASSSLAGEEPMDALRGLVANGRFIEAEGSIARHLESNPEDTVAWSLLADCRRKSFRWFDAVSAYLEVIDRSERSEADLARYKAGVILQDRLGEHRAAVRLFGEYLAGSGDGPLAPDAMSRLAKSLIALGEVERARSLLERVVAEHHDLPAADSARASLGLLDLYAEGSGPPEQHTR